MERHSKRLMVQMRSGSVKDKAGNIGTDSLATTITVDTSKPKSPSVVLSNDTGSSSSDKITSNASLTVSGVEPGNSWEYSLDNGTTWTAGSGNSIPASAFTSDGLKSVQVRQTSAAGNVSDASSAYTFTLDTTAPGQASISIQSGEDATVGDNETGVDLDISYSGLAEGDVIQLKKGGADLGSAHTVTASEAGSGKVSLHVAKSDLSEGSNSITASVKDKAGNTGTDSVATTITLDTTKPATPSVVLSHDTGSSNSDKITSNAGLTVSGVESGNSWEYSLDNGATWTAGSGNSIPASAFSGDGAKNVQVRQTNAAGNVSDASSAYTFTLDTTKPATPSVELNNDTGISASDKITSNAGLNVSGIESGNSWEYSLDNGATWTAGSGNSIPASAFTSDGAKSVQVRQTDVAGNVSDASSEHRHQEWRGRDRQR